MCRTILTLLPTIGLVGSNNLSTAIIILGIGGILIFVSNPGYLEFIGLGSAGAGFIAVFLAAESYRLERLAIWRNPEKYEKDFRRSRDCMPLAAAEYSAEALETVCRNLDLFRKRRMI